MSKKTAASPLLIRHRYQNPFAPPPFPPKLLHISTDPARYADYRFLRNIENEREVLVIPDADLGMPIEPGMEADGTYGLGAYWEGDQNVICPDQSAIRPQLDPEDMALLAEPPPPPGSSISITNGSSQNQTLTVQGSSRTSSASGSLAPTIAPVTDRRKAEVSWLRRTEYFNDVQYKPRDIINSQKKRAPVPSLPKTKIERLAEIHSTFEVVTKQPFKDLKHPTKPNLKAVDAYDFLPDESIWANTYDLYRFQENPTDRPDQSSSMPQAVDERLEHAIIRPLTFKGDTRLAYYLPDSSDGVANYKKAKRERRTIDEKYEPPEPSKEDETENQGPSHELHFVREYEISQQRSLNQNLLIFDDGKTSGRRKGAYFNSIGQFRTLRKRRPKLYEPALEEDEDNAMWDGISVTLSTNPELIESTAAVRRDLLSDVLEPPTAPSKAEKT